MKSPGLDLMFINSYKSYNKAAHRVLNGRWGYFYFSIYIITWRLINYKWYEGKRDIPLAGVVLFGMSTWSALPSSPSFFPATTNQIKKGRKSEILSRRNDTDYELEMSSRLSSVLYYGTTLKKLGRRVKCKYKKECNSLHIYLNPFSIFVIRVVHRCEMWPCNH